MRILFLPALLLASVLIPPSANSQTLHEGYLDHARLTSALNDLKKAHPNVVHLSTIGMSREGRPIALVQLSQRHDNDAQQLTRPAILLIAGADARHRMGTELAIRATEQFLLNHQDTLEEVDILVIPQLNPDGAEHAVGINGGGTRRVVDADRDGLLDEDPPLDLNGDGLITHMRILEPTIDEPATHLADPAENRLNISPKTSEGERATFRVMLEGIDADNDGRFGEDGHGEVLLDRNFMHLWKEHDPAAGPYPLSEPEARALADFVIANPRIVAAVVYGPNDSVISIPDTKPRDSTGRVPALLHPEDKAMQESFNALYKETTGQTRSSNSPSEGSIHGWLYAHRGIPTIATTGWGRPDPSPLPAAEKDEEGEQESQEPANETPTPRNGEDAGWLAYSDRDRDGAGFVAWEDFLHPQLGKVQIGGFTPGFMANPPIEVIETLAPGHARLLQELASRRARVEIDGPVVEEVSPGLYRVDVALRNEGQLPTLTAMGKQSRAVRPISIRLEMDINRIHDGQRVNLLRGLGPHGQRHQQRWLIRPGEEEVRLVIDDPANGVRTIPLDFTQGADQ